MSSRELTEDEVRNNFLDYVWVMIGEWDRIGQKTSIPTRELLSGLAHSLLATLDGTSNLPAFVVSPNPHESDRDFRQKIGENWYPEIEHEVGVNIAGSLHDQLYERKT